MILHSQAKPADPVLVFIHIPKTGGMSILHWFNTRGKAHQNLFVNNTHFVYSEEALTRILVESPKVKYLSSHFILTFPPSLAGRRLLYFTVLRDPVEQFISYVTYIKKVYATSLTDANLRDSVPPDPASLSSREFTRWLLTQDRLDLPFRENYNVNRLAKETYLSLKDPAAPFDRASYQATRLTLAKAVLSQYMAVGITEQMDESIARLRKIAKTQGIEVPSGRVGVGNESNELRDDLSWIHPADEVGALLLKSLEEDRQLYDWAVARFAADMWSKRVSA